MLSLRGTSLAIIIGCMLLSPIHGVAQQNDWLAFYPSIARLRGKLIKIAKYGKPTYGENPERDEKVEIPVLVLPLPVRVKARPGSSVNNESLSNVSFVQLIFPPEAGDFSKYLDREIVVAGNLVRGHKGEHFTDLVMTVKVVNPTGKPLP